MGPHNTGQRLRQVLDLYNVSKAATYILGPFLITDDGQQPVIIGPAPGHFYSEPGLLVQHQVFTSESCVGKKRQTRNAYTGLIRAGWQRGLS